MTVNSALNTESINTTPNAAKGEYLSFVLGNEQYGLDILKVQEIRGYDTVTQIANTPEYIKGVINLRGKIVPILDLRIKFNFDKIEYNELTVVIILNLSGRDVGVVVDGVSDVMALKDDQISAVPAIISKIDTKYIIGIATVEAQMMILVDIEQLIKKEELELVENSAIH
jgi:purine-binding chemotaxis protein CheW